MDPPDPPPSARSLLLECRGVAQRFGGVVALRDVDFSLTRGEVHGVVGTNGAGKSTLMRILAGALPDHEGEIYFGGRRVHLSTPAEARRLGIGMVHQELSGIGQLTVAENLFLGRQPLTRWGLVSWSRMQSLARDFLADLGIDVDVHRRLDRYPLVVRQMVEIAREIHSGARLLILDEPTSALGPRESDRLFELVRKLRGDGVAVAFISHFIEDVLAVCDRVSIFKDGRCLLSAPAASLDKRYVIHAMLGHGLEGREPGYEKAATLPPRAPSTPLLVARGVVPDNGTVPVDLEVAAGECLALYGFVGAGQQALAHALAGAVRRAAGEVLVDGQSLRSGDVRQAVRRGVVLVAADRARSLVSRAEVFKNVSLGHLPVLAGKWLDTVRETRACQALLDRVNCRPADPFLRTSQLSGGNQQKVVFARWLGGTVRVLILEEPTRGMDVGAKEDVMRIVRRLKEQGVAVVLATSEPELALAHADRILVISRGRVAREFSGTVVDKARLMACC